MRLFNKNILLALALLAAAQGCDKEPVTPQDTGAPIMLSAAESGTKALLNNGTFSATKAMLDETSFAKAGNLIKIYDIYTQAGNTTPDDTPYIDDQIKSNGPGNDIWPFVSQRYKQVLPRMTLFSSFLPQRTGYHPNET